MSNLSPRSTAKLALLALGFLLAPVPGYADIIPTLTLTNMSTSACAACPYVHDQDDDTDQTFRLSDSKDIASDASYFGGPQTPVKAVAHAKASASFDIFGGGSTISATGAAHGTARWNGVRVDLDDGTFYWLTSEAEAVQASFLQISFTLTTPYAYTFSSNATGLTPAGSTTGTDAYVKLYDQQGELVGGAGALDLHGVLEPGMYYLMASTSSGVAYTGVDVPGQTDGFAAFDSEWQVDMAFTPVAAVPDVVGLSQAAAISALTNAGFTLGKVTNATSSTVPAGIVISESPGAGSYLAPDAAVDLVVSSGLPAAKTPTLSPAPGTFAVAQTVTLADTTSGASIRFTVDGSTPTPSSPKYTGPLTIDKTTTIKALATATGYAPSPIVSGTYTITTTGIPATPVPLGSGANVNAIAAIGTAVANGGLDTHGNAYAANLLGNSITWSGSMFVLGAASGLDALSSATLNLVQGKYATLKILATAQGGSQVNQPFVVAYTDGTTKTFTQSLSDWKTPQTYAGESKAVTMAYRVAADGSTQTGPYYVYGYSFALDAAKTVKSVKLPANRKVVILAASLSGGAGATTVPVPLGSAANVYALFRDGSTVTNGGADGKNSAYSATLLGTSVSWSGSTFAIGAANTADAISNKTITLPTGKFSMLKFLATGVNGNQPSRTFIVTYTDGSSAAFTRSLSDWHAPQAYGGETKAATLAYKLNADGSQKTGPYYLYGYSLDLDSSKTVKALTLPASRNAVIVSLLLQP